MGKIERTVVLENISLGRSEFTLAHAQALVSYQHQKGKDLWTLVKGSNYEIADGQLIPITNTRTNKDT